MSLSLPPCVPPLPLSMLETLLGVGHPSCTLRTATPSELGAEGQLYLSQSVVSKMTGVKRPLPKTSGFNFTQLIAYISISLLKFLFVSTAILKVRGHELFRFVLFFVFPVHILLTLDSSPTGFVLHSRCFLSCQLY